MHEGIPIGLTKQSLRRSIRDRLRQLSPEEGGQWQAQLLACLQEREELWSQPGTVALFGGLKGEPDLTTLVVWLRERGWRTVLFAVQGEALLPYEVRGLEEQVRGLHGVWEPIVVADRAVPLEALDLILVPGLAFASEDGSRLGRGGGFYDRLLASPKVTARRIGIAYECQVFPTVPREEHDARVSALMTEQKWRCWGTFAEQNA